MDSEQPTKPRKARARSGKKIELNHDRGSQLDLSQNRVAQNQTLVYHQISSDSLEIQKFFESTVYTILVHDFPPKIATICIQQSQLPHVSDIFGQIQLTMVTILHPGMCAFAPTRKTDVALNTYRPPSRGYVRHGAASATARGAVRISHRTGKLRKAKQKIHENHWKSIPSEKLESNLNAHWVCYSPRVLQLADFFCLAGVACSTRSCNPVHGLLLSAAGDRELAPAVGNHLKPMLPLQCLGGFRALVPCDTQASLVRTIAVALVQAQLVQAAHHLPAILIIWLPQRQTTPIIIYINMGLSENRV